MDDEEVAAGFDSLLDDLFAGVDCAGDFGDFAAVLDLEAVDGVRVVAHVADAEEFIEMVRQDVEVHGRVVSGEPKC